MKWFSLIVVLIVGGGLYYGLFMRPAPKGTPQATAEAYVKAAVAGDAATIDLLCLANAASGAREIATKIQAFAPNVNSLSFKAMKTDPPRKGLSMMVRGQLLGIELIEESDVWKIATVSLSE